MVAASVCNYVLLLSYAAYSMVEHKSPDITQTFSILSVVSGFIIFFIDLTMIYYFVIASQRFLNLMYRERHQQFQSTIIKSCTYVVIFMILLRSFEWNIYLSAQNVYLAYNSDFQISYETLVEYINSYQHKLDYMLHLNNNILPYCISYMILIILD